MRDPRDDCVASVTRTVVERTTDQPHTFLEADEATPSAPRPGLQTSRGRWRAVLHHDPCFCCRMRHVNGHGRARRVLGNVGQSFLHDPVSRRLDHRRQVVRLAVDAQLHREPSRGSLGGQTRQAGAAWIHRRVIGPLTQDTDHLTEMLHCGRSPGSDVVRGFPMVFFEVRREFECTGRQRDQAEIMAEYVMHVLGDTRPLAQPSLISDQLLLALQLFGTLPPGPDKLLILTPEPAREPRQHRGCDQHRHKAAGPGEAKQERGTGPPHWPRAPLSGRALSVPSVQAVVLPGTRRRQSGQPTRGSSRSDRRSLRWPL